MKTTIYRIQPVALLALALLLSRPIRGQDTEPFLAAGIKLGANSGLMVKNNGFSLYDKSSSTLGYQGGIFGSVRALSFLRVRAEVLYYVQGAQLQDIVLSSNYKNINGKVMFNTLQIPVMIELGLPGVASIRPKLLLGGFYSSNLNTQYTYNQVYTFNGNTQLVQGQGSDVSSLFKKSQYGFLVGVGASVSKLFIEVRYSAILNDVAVNGFQYGLLGNATKNYGPNLYPASISLNLSYPLFTF
jgi:hypothetical protein